jgi:hypothetical protein
MKCSKCGEFVTIKVTDEWITLKCNCEILICYSDKFIVRKTKEEYDKKYQEG